MSGTTIRSKIIDNEYCGKCGSRDMVSGEFEGDFPYLCRKCRIETGYLLKRKNGRPYSRLNWH